MKQEWVDLVLKLSATKADFYSCARKIIRTKNFTFNDDPLSADDALVMADCGFTKSKMSMLVRNYKNEESIEAAMKLWDRRLEQDKYGSIGFSTYNHYIKGGGLRNPWELAQAKKSGKPYRASVMGPCIQSVTLTLMKGHKTSIDVFYRTTELFKKFPADLVFLRDVLLPPFNLERAPVTDINFHFANITCHPMYFVTVIPHLEDPIAELEKIRKADKYFFDWIVKWTARYICDEHMRGIQKFAQALRVQMDARKRIDKKTMRLLQKYLRDHHPGHRNDYTSPEADEED